jgi:hypothetical protein
MNKAEEFLKSKGIHIGYAKGIRMIPVSGDAEYNLLELMEQYAQQRERETATQFCAWFESMSHKHKGRTWIEIYDEWYTNHQNQER